MSSAAAENSSQLPSGKATKEASLRDKDLPPIPERSSVEEKATNGLANGVSYDAPRGKSNGSTTGAPTAESRPPAAVTRATAPSQEAEDYINGGLPHTYCAGPPAAGSAVGASSSTSAHTPPGISPGISPGAAVEFPNGATTSVITEEPKQVEQFESPPDTPGPAGRRGVQFTQSDAVIDAPFAGSHSRQSSLDTANPSSRSRIFMSRLKALAAQGGLPTPRTPGTPSNGFPAESASPSPGRSARDIEEEGSDADAEETADEAAAAELATRLHKRKKRMSYRMPQRNHSGDGLGISGIATEPGTPVLSSRIQAMLQRRVTMPEAAEQRGGLSEGEGRDQLSRQHGWRRSSTFAGRAAEHEEMENTVHALGHVRRRTVFGGGVSDGDAMTPRRAFFPAERATTYGVQKWRQVKNTLKMLRQKRDDRFDYKSAELMAELRAGAPAVLMLASMIQRDEHGNKRIPVLLEQLRLSISDSTPMQDGDSERHWLFTIDLEYGSGPSRMRWTIKRTIREILELHWKYKLALRNDKYLHTLPVGARPKQPKFPVSAFPYVRGLRGLEIDDEDDAASMHGGAGDDATADAATDAATDAAADGNGTTGENTAAEGTATDVEGGGRSNLAARRKKARIPVLGMSRRSSAAAGADSLAGTEGQRDTLDEAGFRRKYVDKQQRVLEKYLTEMVHWLIFRADSNRLCRFLELSALGVRLAAEGSYHGKECFLHIQSSKGLDFRRVMTPGKVIERHSRKWFLVRQSYIVCVESPENMNIYDVYLVDPKFVLIAKKSKQKTLKVKKEKIRPGSAGRPGTAQTELERELANEQKTSKHHTLTIMTSERKVKLWGRTQHLIAQFEESIMDMLKQTPWHQRHRFDSFAPVRHNVFAQWLVDGRDYMWNVSRAIAMAKDVIYIHDWWLSPELYMRRPACISQKWRLDRLLQRKASEGVKIFVIVYRNVEAAVPIDSEYTKFSLLNLHPNIFVQRSPNQFKKNQFFFAHHEKICVVDHDVAFLGGIDLCFGRWDSPQHTLVDDKPTGFELDEQPRDVDHCQLWPGKDYSNPRVQDFFSLREPYKEMYDRTKVPRMPWHDVAMQVVGQPARDLTRLFVQRWNYVRRGRKPTRPTPFLLPPPDFQPEDLDSLGLSGTCEVQILRSASAWSLGITDVECSIQTAYINLIEESEHFVYMENQFFITSTETLNVKIVNRIGDALVERILRAHRDDEDWRCVIIIPLMPGFESSVADQEGTSVRLILQCQYRSISRGENSIFGRLRAAGIDPEDYIQFFSLRQWGRINNKTVLTTEQLYIHAKIILVDDRVALIGSANINERSLLGDRDSEVAAIVRDRDMIESTMAGQPYLVGRFAHTLRMRLMREHLGLDTDAIMEEEQQREVEFEAEMHRLYSDGPDAGEGEGGEGQSEGAAGHSDVEMPRKTNINHDIDLEDYDDDVDTSSAKRTRPTLGSLSRFSGLSGLSGLSGHTDGDQAGSTEAVSEALQENHTRDVKGEGADRWSAAKSKGQDQMRDSTVVAGREVLVDASFADKKHLPTLERKSTSASKKSTGGADSNLLAVPPMPSLTVPQSDSATDNNTAVPPASPINPLAADIRTVNVTKDCMRDPIDPVFYDEVWARVAENNTKLYRRVFRCMPDSEATNWHEFQEFTAYSDRFRESMENRKRGGTVGEDTDHMRPRSRQQSRHAGGGGAGISVPAVPPLPGAGSAVNEKTGQTGGAEHGGDADKNGHADGGEKRTTFADKTAKPSEKEKDTAEGHATGSNPPVNVGSVKRRRRGTTKSSRRGFQGTTDEVLSKADAETLLEMVQGHVVQFPYDWLLVEEGNGNWLYQVDQVAPLQIYN